MRTSLLLLPFIFLLSCQGQQDRELKNDSTKIENMQNTKEIVYGLSVQIGMPFELYVNDIAVAKEYSKARKIRGIDLNSYLLKNGTYPVKIKLLPLEENGKMVVRPTDVATSFVKFVQYEIQREPMMGRAKNFKMIRQLPLPEINEALPLLEAEWEIEATELPYELKGWSNSQDLREMDRDDLEKEVKDFYVKLRDALNSGNPEMYFKHAQQRSEETTVFDYLEEGEMNESILINSKKHEKQSEGNMWPIEKYELFVYGNGKLFSLERIDEANRGWNCLIRSFKGVKTTTGSILHRPSGSNSFEIIRK